VIHKVFYFLQSDGLSIKNLNSKPNQAMLDKITNRAYEARPDWLNHFYSPWEPEGYKVENQDDQLQLILRPHLSHFGSSHHRRPRNNANVSWYMIVRGSEATIK